MKALEAFSSGSRLRNTELAACRLLLALQRRDMAVLGGVTLREVWPRSSGFMQAVTQHLFRTYYPNPWFDLSISSFSLHFFPFQPKSSSRSVAAEFLKDS